MFYKITLQQPSTLCLITAGRQIQSAGEIFNEWRRDEKNLLGAFNCISLRNIYRKDISIKDQRGCGVRSDQKAIVVHSLIQECECLDYTVLRDRSHSAPIYDSNSHLIGIFDL